MPELKRETIVHLTELSCIDCTEDEIERFFTQIHKMVAHFEQLAAIDTENVPPCHQVSEGLICPMREDVVANTLDTKTFLDNVPSHIGGLVRVPTVIQNV
ncbi:MAG: Asp-tRNA(Asn)/Glu-tRNA(Gln) amidotransferase subunit GatC [Verrucomicrobia bacterium]|nr:Asp-tRNA(Asn)/Glu-tRNA(Gln) amidotransferase subunit GatC [Verrucomicrobiota bacterium]